MPGASARRSRLAFRLVRATLWAFAGVLTALAPVARAQDEFLLNDDRVHRNQWEPVVARGATGTLVVAWQDGRNGTGSFEDYDIFTLTIRNAFAIGTSINRRISDGPAGQTQANPDIAASPAGTFFCAWVDSRLGDRDIFGVALDTLGIPVSPNLRISDDVSSEDQFAPRVTPVQGDRYLVVWGDGRDGLGEIFGSYRTAYGAPIGANVRLSNDPVPGGSSQGDPAAAAAPDGRALVVWTDGRNGATLGATFDIYGQWLDAAGVPIGENFKVNDATGAQSAGTATVSASADGFVVAWIDRRRSGDPGDVWAQRYGPDGTPLGVNVRVNDDAGSADQRFVRSCDGAGGAMVFWEDFRGGLGLDSNVEGALVPWTANPAGANFRVNVVTSGRQGNPASAWDGFEAAVVVWEDLRRGSSDIYALPILPDGTARGADAQLNDDAAPFDQRRPRLGDGRGRYLATWLDLRGSGSDLYAQWITSAGARDGPNQLLWDDNFADRPLAASSTVGPTGVALAAAQVTRSFDAGEIRGFLLPSLGEGVASSFWISDLLPSAQSSPAVAAAADGFGAVWIDTRDAAVRLYGQRLDLAGARIGVNHAVLLADPVDPVYALALTGAPGGGYWLVFAEGATAEQRLWLAALDSDLVAAGPAVSVGDGAPGAKIGPSVGVTPAGRVEVVWLGDGASGLGQVYFQAFEPGGTGATPLSAPILLGTPGVAVAHASPSVASGLDASAVVWAARPSGDWGIWLQRVRDGLVPIGAAVRMDQDLLVTDQLDPTAGLDGAGNVLAVWTDSRSTSSGTDILGRVIPFATTAASEPRPEPTPDPTEGPTDEPEGSPPAAIRVGLPRPNPFLAGLGVPVQLSARAAAHLRVTVRDARGRPVRRLLDGPAASTATTLGWDGRDDRGRKVASGVYWFDIQGGGERHALRVVRLR
ncbi:MAG TPA: FlgD immunoglobulin-like domain containing protein [Acidobacteriota bacterium]|nr:FlgD immunoglobulin-like domain containing protein [Acidobacteriota bacterium]